MSDHYRCQSCGRARYVGDVKCGPCGATHGLDRTVNAGQGAVVVGAFLVGEEDAEYPILADPKTGEFLHGPPKIRRVRKK